MKNIEKSSCPIFPLEWEEHQAEEIWLVEQQALPGIWLRSMRYFLSKQKALQQIEEEKKWPCIFFGKGKFRVQKAKLEIISRKPRGEK